MDPIFELISAHKRELFELAKIATGSFLGFGLALLSARLLDYRKRRREHLIAGSVALFTLKNQYNDFLLFRRDFRENVARSELTGNEPIWALLQPTFLQIDGSTLDFNSIGFLLEQGRYASTFDDLQSSQISHRDLLGLQVKRNDALVKLQDAAVNTQKKISNSNLTDVEKEAGGALISLCNTLAITLANRSLMYEATYRRAHDSLRLALLENRNTWYGSLFDAMRSRIIFKHASPPFLKLNVASPGFREEDLPPIPKTLEVALRTSKIPRWGTQQ